ncbi:MAG: hypothetical protein ACLU40_03950 [Acutalibacteraceae bacterium]
MARPALKCRGFITFKDGRCIPIEEMTEDERERVSKSMNERLSRVMSEYYTNHPEEF